MTAEVRSGRVDGAYVTGIQAWLFYEVIDRHELHERLSRMTPPMRQEAVDFFQALRDAAKQFDDNHQEGLTGLVASSGSGTAEVTQTEVAGSSRHDHISLAEAAQLLGVSDRWARQLARDEGLGRKVGGRWVLSRTACMAFRRG